MLRVPSAREQGLYGGEFPDLANGYTGQTTETLALPNESQPFERVVGVPLKSYISLSFSYRLR